MIPVCLVTGFLGSGKTTFLQKLADRYADMRIVYLINEFSQVNVDGNCLDIGLGGVTVVAGGSIFCHCKVTDFVGQLQNIEESAGLSPGQAVEGVVIEASGIADPRVISKLFRETGLDERYNVATIVSIVSPGSFIKLRATLPNIVSQIESANIVLLNKTDQFPEAEIQATHDAVKEINPNVEIIITTHCETRIDPLSGRTERNLEGEYAKCSDPNYRTFAVEMKQDTAADEIESVLQRFKAGIYRVKGFIKTADGPVYIDYSHEGFTATVHNGKEVEYSLVFILSGESEKVESEISACLETQK